MKNRSYKIDFEIYIVFIIVIGISVFNAIYSSLNISKNQEATSKVMMVDVPSLQLLENMNLLIIKSKMYSTNWVYLQSNKEDKEMLKLLQGLDYPALKGNIKVLMNGWKKREDIDSMNYVFAEFEKLMIYQSDLMHTLVKFEDYNDASKVFQAERIVEREILPQSATIITQLNKLLLKKRTDAELVHIEMLNGSRRLMWSVLTIAILIVLVILIAAFYMSNHIIVPTMKLKNFIVKMAKGEVPEQSFSIRSNAVGQMTEAVIVLAESMKMTTRFAHTIGEGNLSAEYQLLSDSDELGNALLHMRNNLRKADEENKQRNLLSARTEQVNDILREYPDDIYKLSDAITSTLVKQLKACYGGLYLIEDSNSISQRKICLYGSYGMDGKAKSIIQDGDGLIGQAIKDGEVLYMQDAPSTYTFISSGLGCSPANQILIIPLKHHGKVYGANELAGFAAFENFEIGFIKSIGESIGSTISSVMANTFTKKLLSETQKQAEQLRLKEDELVKANQDLSYQSVLLLTSEEELKRSNIEMKHKARELEHKNEVLEQAREVLSVKAKELELNNRYKSEFLANMSHELRTPLNSVLILAKLLAENKNKNLSEKQEEYARVIHKSGNDLLLLINDILDLSKIEAGKVELIPEMTEVVSIKSDIQSLFREFAIDKKIDFVVETFSGVPDYFLTDKVRLEQIIKNLLSNAFKFTPANGNVTFKIKLADPAVEFMKSSLSNSNTVIEFSVTDTGIGIPLEKQALIFEAFQQADGSTSRKYGGTGLGLSISKMLVGMLGGEMQLKSVQGKGSTFFVYLPITFSNEIGKQFPEAIKLEIQTKEEFVFPLDDRNNLKENERVILIAERDIMVANVLLNLAHDKNYKAIIAINQNELIELSEKFKLDAILIDTNIDMENSTDFIDSISAQKEFADIPFHILSRTNEDFENKTIGATTYLKKPLDKRDLDDAFFSIDKTLSKLVKKVLIVEDMVIHQQILKNLVATHYSDTDVFIVGGVIEAKNLLDVTDFDCIILDLDLGNGSEEGCDLLKSIKVNRKTMHIPVIVFTGSDLDNISSETLAGLSDAIITKDNHGLERLLKETDGFLNKIKLDQPIVPIEKKAYDNLEGKKILLVDDDMRNIYALTNMLENRKMIVIPATNGIEALEKLQNVSGVDIVLMDIMMPEMDGYEAIKRIREMQRFNDIPIIALTAKAMIQDKEKCIEAGASDYISKPVNMDTLSGLIYEWLNK